MNAKRYEFHGDDLVESPDGSWMRSEDYAAALARAEAAERAHRETHADAQRYYAAKTSTESRLAGATALLKSVPDAPGPAWLPWMSRRDAFLSASTPAPAAEPECPYCVPHLCPEHQPLTAPAAESEPEALQAARDSLDQVNGATRVRALESRIAELETQYTDTVKVYEIRIRQVRDELENARAISGNRWSEWGSRAESVGELLDSALELLRGNRT